jgi:hypothetical protein
MIRTSARKRAKTTRERGEIPIMGCSGRVFGFSELLEDREDGLRHQGSAWFADGVVEDVRIGEPDHNGSGDLGGHGGFASTPPRRSSGSRPTNSGHGRCWARRPPHPDRIDIPAHGWAAHRS